MLRKRAHFDRAASNSVQEYSIMSLNETVVFGVKSLKVLFRFDHDIEERHGECL